MSDKNIKAHFDKSWQKQGSMGQSPRSPALPFPFGPGPRGDVMVGWWPETLC
ncbi:hypothetical protein B4119_0530 [Parageobacillus caldoxylosilyticus]|uniref:Uncharacterized protein n=1 Tax=Saccharococcus caldoxylosilyticus TaxID=81408 RepID=A0A150LWX2_9BACL|nr:hypothetical protein B4119_0530 [Parageobacillus caldoxylosilyticus]